MVAVAGLEEGLGRVPEGERGVLSEVLGRGAGRGGRERGWEGVEGVEGVGG